VDIGCNPQCHGRQARKQPAGALLSTCACLHRLRSGRAHSFLDSGGGLSGDQGHRLPLERRQEVGSGAGGHDVLQAAQHMVHIAGAVEGDADQDAAARRRVRGGARQLHEWAEPHRRDRVGGRAARTWTVRRQTSCWRATSACARCHVTFCHRFALANPRNACPQRSRAPVEQLYPCSLAPALCPRLLLCAPLLATMFSLSALDELDKQTGGAPLRMRRVHAALQLAPRCCWRSVAPSTALPDSPLPSARCSPSSGSRHAVQADRSTTKGACWAVSASPRRAGASHLVVADSCAICAALCFLSVQRKEPPSSQPAGGDIASQQDVGGPQSAPALFDGGAVRMGGGARTSLCVAQPVTAADSTPASAPLPSSPQRRRNSRVRCCALRRATCECRSQHRPPRRSRRRSCCRRRRCGALEAHSRPAGRPCQMPGRGRPPRLLPGCRLSRAHPSPAWRPRLLLGQAAQVLGLHLRLLAAPRQSG
jgi:hypothetical protein